MPFDEDVHHSKGTNKSAKEVEIEIDNLKLFSHFSLKESKAYILLLTLNRIENNVIVRVSTVRTAMSMRRIRIYAVTFK